MVNAREFVARTAFVTGSSRGIGRAIAARLATLGASVAVHGTTATSAQAFGEAESLEAVARSIGAETGSTVVPVYGNLADPAVAADVVRTVRTALGRIDILVNCAGGDIGAAGTAAPMGGRPSRNDALLISLEDLHAVLSRNLMTCLFVCREVAPEMVTRKSGRIINIGSLAGMAGVELGAIYATAKAAVHEYTRCLAMQLRQHNVTVNAIAPGEIITARFAASRSIDDGMLAEGGTLIRYGRPAEIANVAAFLASEEAGYISGQVIRVDGGRQCFPG
jgi:NAD(P)-dependent dehydrogenase (short-subunit alcohol dehydrogenase family)